VRRSIATGAALRERRLRSEQLASEPGVRASTFWVNEKTLAEVLATSPDEFRRWKTFAQAPRAVGDD